VKVGETFQAGEVRQEVIAMVARRDRVEHHLHLMRRVRLDVSSVQIGSFALVECFKRLMPTHPASCFFVDIGATCTHAVISHGSEVVFAKKIWIGGDDFTRACARAEGLTFAEAKLRRASRGGPTEVGGRNGGEPPAAPANRDPIALAIRPHVERLAGELAMCARYYESVFQGNRIGRLIFLGGEANQRVLCEQIARTLRIDAQIGDPFAQVSAGDNEAEPGAGRSAPQPAWAVAMGCALAGVGNGSEVLRSRN
jgi:Tfp pilus assembly PilM family ATPase